VVLGAYARRYVVIFGSVCEAEIEFVVQAMTQYCISLSSFFGLFCDTVSGVERQRD
jgi:hypothetical protein